MPMKRTESGIVKRRYMQQSRCTYRMARLEKEDVLEIPLGQNCLNCDVVHTVSVTSRHKAQKNKLK